MNRLGVALLLLALAGCSTGGGSTPSPTAPGFESIAHDTCRKAVVDGLKAPATAAFQPGETVDQNPDDSWTVDGQVDAENSFGALIRNDYHCHIQIAADGTATMDGLDITAP